VLRKEYIKRFTLLRKKGDEADVELESLRNTRQSLIEKNLSGVYSDEIFREQNTLIERKIAALEVTKSDTFVERYNLEEIIKFISGYLLDLGETYKNSNPTQKEPFLVQLAPMV
jgi:hypothetical protein